MWSWVRSLDIFKIRLKADKIPCERARGKIHIRFRERGVDHQQWVHRWCAGNCGPREEGLQGEIPTDVVWNRVGEVDILEAAGGDLEVVLWITPRPKAVISGVRKYRRMVEVRSIWLQVRTGTRDAWPETLPCVQSQ